MEKQHVPVGLEAINITKSFRKVEKGYLRGKDEKFKDVQQASSNDNSSSKRLSNKLEKYTKDKSCF